MQQLDIRSVRIYSAAKRLIYYALFRLGFPAIARWLNRGRVLVLTYHDVLPAGFDRTSPIYGMAVSVEEFTWQMSWISKKYNPITLSLLRNWLARGESLPPNPVLVTFDDGHQNIAELALPILKQFGIQAACFVLSDYLGEFTRRIWYEDLYFRIQTTSSTSLDLSDGLRIDLHTREQRISACGRIFGILREMAWDRQECELKHIRDALQMKPDEPLDVKRFSFLGDKDLTALRLAGMEVQSHGISHRILATLDDEASSKEIAGSKTILEKRLNSEVYALAYPFGDRGMDISSREERFAREAGYAMAFCSGGGLVARNSERYALPRVSVGMSTRATFCVQTSGLYEFLSPIRRLLNRAPRRTRTDPSGRQASNR